MAVLRMFADVLQECHAGRKTGALFISVVEASENLVRFYFQEGKITSISYGTARDRECLDILDCYNLGKAVYFDGMRIATASNSLPGTPEIIAAIRKAGKQVQMDR